MGIPNANTDKKISIHALLAESDVLPSYYTSRDYIFLSTLSLRRATATPRAGRQAAAISIHALLAESDYPSAVSRPHAAISIHALLAESDFFPCVIFAVACQFLSTLSLRRATEYWVGGYGTANNFYPRSPCGERPSKVLCATDFF